MPPFSCTISVSEGNYDYHNKLLSIIMVIVVALFPFLKGITTTSQTISGWDKLPKPKVALFPFLKGITTNKKDEEDYSSSSSSLHYFRFWRELRQQSKILVFLYARIVKLHYFRFWRELRRSNEVFCWWLISIVALFPFLKGITTILIVSDETSPKICCTISVSEGNYDSSQYLPLIGSS